MSKKKSETLSNQVRKAIENCGMSRYAISQETGIDQAVLSRFIREQAGLSLDALDRLGDYLQLKITMGRKPGKKEK